MNSQNFRAWHDAADLPTQAADGSWYDAETGHRYDPESDYAAASRRATPRKAISKKADASRGLAKAIGGKALAGSMKQKNWAEKIRAEKLGAMTQEQAALACAPAGLGRSAFFWIENRERPGSAIGDFFVKQKSMLADAKQLRDEGRAEEYAAAAARYNAFTAEWGFA